MMLDGCISVGVVFTQVGALFVCDAVFSKDDDLSQWLNLCSREVIVAADIPRGSEWNASDLFGWGPTDADLFCDKISLTGDWRLIITFNKYVNGYVLEKKREKTCKELNALVSLIYLLIEKAYVLQHLFIMLIIPPIRTLFFVWGWEFKFTLDQKT